MHHVDDPHSPGARFYRAAMHELQRAEVPFLVGGAYALEVHTGVVRRTKDFDIFLKRDDVDRALAVLSRAGYQAELTFPHWIAKAFFGDDFIDIIFSSGNGLCEVDDEWFEHAVEGRVLDIPLPICPAEETIWQKAYILERNRCDVADVAHLLRHCGDRLDWPRLMRRFGAHWRVLLAQLMLFDFIYPGHRAVIPQEIRRDLASKVADQSAAEPGSDCFGTLLSATQYLGDVNQEGYRDARLPPLGEMLPHDIAVWTANFMKPG